MYAIQRGTARPAIVTEFKRSISAMFRMNSKVASASGIRKSRPNQSNPMRTGSETMVKNHVGTTDVPDDLRSINFPCVIRYTLSFPEESTVSFDGFLRLVALYKACGRGPMEKAFPSEHSKRMYF